MNASDISIGFRGLLSDALGIALWQADGRGSEPAATGHVFVTPIETITAHYYVASRDYVDPHARGGLVATELCGAWPRLRAAFAARRGTIHELILRVPLTTSGADREGEDWFYRDGIETRYLQPQAPLPLLCNAATLLEFAPPRLVLTEDYRHARQFDDVKIRLTSEPMPVVVAAGETLDGDARGLVDAFIADLGGRPVRFVVEAIRLTPQTFDGQGRTSGRYAEIPSARIEVVEN